MHSSAFSHCVKESDSSRLFCSICRSNCGQMLLHFGILTGSRTVRVFLQLMPALCVFARGSGASQKRGASGYAHTTAQKELQALLVYILATVSTCMKKFLGSAVWQQFAQFARLQFMCAIRGSSMFAFLIVIDRDIGAAHGMDPRIVEQLWTTRKDRLLRMVFFWSLKGQALL